MSCWLVGGSGGGGARVVVVVLPPGGNVVVTVVDVVVLPPGGSVVVTIVVVVVSDSMARGARKRSRFSFLPRTVTCAVSQAGEASVASSVTLRAVPQVPRRAVMRVAFFVAFVCARPVQDPIVIAPDVTTIRSASMPRAADSVAESATDGANMPGAQGVGLGRFASAGPASRRRGRRRSRRGWNTGLLA